LALKITEQELDGVTAVSMEGQIVLGEESSAFREKMEALLMADKKRIVLNVACVTYIDSVGVGALVASFNSARLHGATLKLANLGSRFREILQVTRLLTVFDTYQTEAAAIQSFGKARQQHA
jgi:anti-sigma B factor antagonist